MGISIKKILSLAALIGLLFSSSVWAARTRQITFRDDPRTALTSVLCDLDFVPRNVLLSLNGEKVIFDGVTSTSPYTVIQPFALSWDGSNLTNLASSLPFPLLEFGSVGGRSTISNDGNVAVFTHGADLYKINTDGTGLELLASPHPEFFIRPKLRSTCLSGDGTKLFLSTDKDMVGLNPEEDFEIFSVDLVTGSVEQLTFNTQDDDYDVHCTTDGSRVAYTTMGVGNLGINLLEKIGDSYDTTILANSSPFSKTSSPYISKNGGVAAYLKHGPYGYGANLFTVLSNGTGTQQITNLSGTFEAYDHQLTNNGDLIVYGVWDPGFGCGLLSDPPLIIRNGPVFLASADGTNIQQLPFPSWFKIYNFNINHDATRIALIARPDFGEINNDSEDTLGKIYAMDRTKGQTVVGADMNVVLDSDVRVTFSNVTTTGETNVIIADSVGLRPNPDGVQYEYICVYDIVGNYYCYYSITPPPAPHDEFGVPGFHYFLGTSAVYTRSATVCLNYSGRFSAPSSNTTMKLLRRDGDSWTDITTFDDPVGGEVCGESNVLGEFVARQVSFDGNTPVGPNVGVDLGSGVSVAFDNVSLPGQTTLTKKSKGSDVPPAPYRLAAPPAYYEIETNAIYSGQVEVCLSYDDANLQQQEKNVRIFHWVGHWEDVTSSLDMENNIVCGTTNSLSEFIAATATQATGSTPPPQSINLIKDRMGLNGTPGCAITLNRSTDFGKENASNIVLLVIPLFIILVKKRTKGLNKRRGGGSI